MAGRALSRPSMRPVTRTFSDLHAALYRLTGGAAQNPNYPTMLLTVTGRKTGKPRTVPLIYLEDGDRLVIAAAYAGSDANPTWWLNLREDPEAVCGHQHVGRHACIRLTDAAMPQHGPTKPVQPGNGNGFGRSLHDALLVLVG